MPSRSLRRPSTARQAVTVLFVVQVIRLVLAAPVTAQDTHYWHDQIGNRALLLSGAVVGDPADVSAIYYNPGGLALNDSIELLLAGIGIQLDGTRVKNAVAPGEDLSRRRFAFTPSLIAGEIPMKKEKHRFAYSLMKRHKTELRADAQAVLPGDAFALPTIEVVSNRVRVDTSLTEYWAGGTWSFRARPNLGVGASMFIAQRGQRSLVQNFFQVLSLDNLAAVADVDKSYDYDAWRLLWKLGVAGELARWKLGATVTTPGIGLFGSGDTNHNLTILGQTIDDKGNPVTEIAADVQEGLSAEYRSPLSVAFGASRLFGATTLHFSGEWFASVDEYTVIDSQPFDSQSSGRTIETAVTEELSDVLNVAVGVQYEFRDSLKGYAGFHTDFSAVSPNTTTNLSLTKWDFYHFSGGATFTTAGRDFTLGANLGLAREVIHSDPTDPFRPRGLPDEADFRIQADGAARLQLRVVTRN